jgi:hypothetical protein
MEAQAADMVAVEVVVLEPQAVTGALLKVVLEVPVYPHLFQEHLLLTQVAGAVAHILRAIRAWLAD